MYGNPNMQMMASPAYQGMGLNMGLAMGMGGMNSNPNFFFFTGNSLSLQSRLNSMSD